MPERLLAAVQELNENVARLEETFKEYPKRQEIAEQYETKQELKENRKRLIMTALAILLISLFVSYFVTVTTITSCFVSEGARTGDATAACGLLPGYNEAQEENQQLIKELRVLLNTPETNSNRLDRIEKKLGLPPLPDEGNN